MTKLVATELLRRLGFTGPIKALIRDEEAAAALIEAGVTTVSMPMAQAGIELAKACSQTNIQLNLQPAR